MSEHSDALRAPSVFVASEEAHLELIKLRDHTRLLARMSDPSAVTLQECPMHPRALAWSYATISRALDEYLQATHWSDDPALDLEEAHARAADIRERNRGPLWLRRRMSVRRDPDPHPNPSPEGRGAFRLLPTRQPANHR